MSTFGARGGWRRRGSESERLGRQSTLSDQPTRRYAVIAAAGRGSRFTHEVPKVLADVGGRPCVQRVLDALESGLGDHEQLIVIGEHGEDVRETIGEAPHRRYVVQNAPRGTGDALLTALAEVPLDADGHLYFFCGDKPLLQTRTVERFRHRFESCQAKMLFLTGRIEGGEEALLGNRQGRVVSVEFDGSPHALGIVERKVIDAVDTGQTFQLYNGVTHHFTRDSLLRIREVNVSTYAWCLPELRGLAGELSDDNAQGEFLVTDLVQTFLRAGHPVQTMALSDPWEGRGIDTVQQWQEIRDR